MESLTLDKIQLLNQAIPILITEAILSLLLPVILIVIWKKKTRVSLKPFSIGILFYFIFAQILRLILGLVFTSLFKGDNAQSDPWLFCLYDGILTGVVQESARILAFAVVLKKYKDIKDPVTFGIGFGGLESVALALSALILLMLSLYVSHVGFDAMTEGMDQLTKTVITQNMKYRSFAMISDILMSIADRISIYILQISHSVFIFVGLRRKEYRFLVPVAFVIHIFVGFSAAFYITDIISYTLYQVFFFIFAAGVAFTAFRLYRKISRTKEDETDGV